MRHRLIELWKLNFYPRSPCGERPWTVFLSCNYPLISIHALLAESDRVPLAESTAESISIHALLAESDLELLTERLCNSVISIHALLAESDFLHGRNRHNVNRISIHALLAESDKTPHQLQSRSRISIHALLAESDREPTALRTPHQRFLSTLSLRRATAKVHKTVGHFCAYETNFMEIASSC